MFSTSSVQPRKLSGFDATELFTHFRLGNDFLFGDDGDAAFGGDQRFGFFTWSAFWGLKKLSAMKAASQLMSGPIGKRSSCHLIQLSNQPVDWVGNVSGSPWFSSVQIA